MTTKNPKHEIVIITYNQENTILGAFMSAINQTVSPYKISIFDDCSTDNTVSVLKKALQTTTIPVELHSNPTNLGIFPNFNQAMQHTTGDMVHILAGDDELELDLIENYNKYIEEEKIDLSNPVWIIPNITELHENGKTKKINQYKRNKKYPIVESILAQKIRTFETGMSLSAAKKSCIRTDMSYQADNLKSILVCKSADVRLADFYAYRYRVYTGVTLNQGNINAFNSRKSFLTTLLRNYDEVLTLRERKIAQFELVLADYLFHPTIKLYLSCLRHILTLLLMKDNVYGFAILKRAIPIGVKNYIKSTLLFGGARK